MEQQHKLRLALHAQDVSIENSNKLLMLAVTLQEIFPVAFEGLGESG